MDNYLALAEEVLTSGIIRGNRTSTPVSTKFARTLVYDLRRGFPLVTTKSVNFSKVMAELCAFLRGSTSAADFRQFGTKIWDENANDNTAWLKNPFRAGEDHLGPIYGHQWRAMDSVKLVRFDAPNFVQKVDAYQANGYQFQGSYAAPDDSTYGPGTTVVMYKKIDQLRAMVDNIKNNPNDRRHIVNAWNPADIPEMALPPCHTFFQCYARDNYLDLQMYQRSADLFLGVPYNIASYAALLHLLAKETGRAPGMLTMVFGDVHIYADHVEQVTAQLKRTPRQKPSLSLRSHATIDNVVPDDFILSNYRPCPALPAKMANN